MQLTNAALAVTLGTALALPGTGLADGKRAFRIEDLYRLKTVSGAAVSPDGASVVYSVSTTDLKATKRTASLWRVDADGKDARRLTFADGRDESPFFAPDGRLAFVSTRGGEPQVWVFPAGGGEPERKTGFPGGVSDPVFTPDGQGLVFVAEVYPECGADAACNKKLDDLRENGKLKAHVADTLLYRHWDAWRDGKRVHVLHADLASGKVRDLTPGDFDSPPYTSSPRGFDVSPDGKELVFASNRDADQAMSTNSDLYAVTLDASDEALRSPRKLTSNGAWDGQPRYSPDGASIAYRTQSTAGYESDRIKLALVDRKGGTSRILSENFDNWITDFAFARDGRIFFTADVKARTPLSVLDPRSGAITTVSSTGTLAGISLAPDASWAATVRKQIHRPTEVWRLDVKLPGERALSAHNAEVEAEVDIRPAEEVFVPGAGGKPVQMWIVKPHGFDPAKKYPVILNVHGGPQQQWSDSFRGDWQVYPGSGYVVAFPNPHGSTGFGQAYTAAISGDWDGKVMEDIRKVTEYLAKQPYVDPKRMGAMGWSWGGYAMMWLEGHNLGFAALASMMGVYDLRAMYSATEELWFPHWDVKGAPWENPEIYKRMSPSEYVKSYRTPCLVITGEKDFRVPFTQSLEFFTDLQRMKVPSRLVVFEKASHWPAWYEMALYYAAHLDWFHRYLGGAPSPWDPVEMSRSLTFAEEDEKPAQVRPKK